MHQYIPNTDEQKKSMLEHIGVSDISELFDYIPKDLILDKSLNIPSALSEMELSAHINLVENKNKDCVCFLGAGMYDHYVPTVVGHITSLPQFYTAYTPYQPEISQGTLQAIFEFQTMMCSLTGMDATNASMYDGATAMAEAMLMAASINSKKEIIILSSVNPQYLKVCETYANYRGINIVISDHSNGRVDITQLSNKISADTAAVIIQSPNFFGIIEDLEEAGKLVKSKGAMLIVSADPISLGLLEPPSSFGADIVAGEGQPLGNKLGYGNGFGFLTAKKAYARKMPGRIVGETTDAEGKRGFVLTLQAREQHIRRDKATSNICSNQALNALAASVYMSLTGKSGLRKVAELCFNKANYMYKKLIETGKFEPVFDQTFFREFVVRYIGTESIGELNKRLLAQNYTSGYDLSKDFSQLQNCLLIAVTECRTKQQIDSFVEIISAGSTEKGASTYER